MNYVLRSLFGLLPLPLALPGAILVPLLLPSCGAGSEVSRAVRELQGYEIELIARNELSGSEREQLFDNLEEALTAVRPDAKDSEIGTLNRRAGEKAVEVSPQVYRLLEKGRLFSELTDGVYDITAGPVRALWRESRGSGNRPPREAVFEAVELIDYRQLELSEEEHRAYLKREGMKIDPEPLIRGWAADLAVARMQEMGAFAGAVRVDSVYRCFGSTERTYHFPPEEVDTGVTGEFRLEDGACVTVLPAEAAETSSPGVRRLYDTTTGVPLRSGVRLALVAGPDAISTDALAQIMVLYGTERGMQLIGETPFFHGLVVEQDGDAYFSPQIGNRFDLSGENVGKPVLWGNTKEEQ